MKKSIQYIAVLSMFALIASCTKPAADDSTELPTTAGPNYTGTGYNPNGVGGQGAGATASGYYISATVDGKAYTCYTVGSVVKSKPPAAPSISIGGSMIIAPDTYAVNIFVPQYYGAGLYKGTQKAVLSMDNLKGTLGSFALPIFASSGVSNDLVISVISDDAKQIKGAFSATTYDLLSMFNGNVPVDTMNVTNGSFYLRY